MILEQFLKVIGSEIIRVERGDRGDIIYEADKNAIRMNKPELLTEIIYSIEPKGSKFIVHLEV